jgi:hypothetical protein
MPVIQQGHWLACRHAMYRWYSDARVCDFPAVAVGNFHTIHALNSVVTRRVVKFRQKFPDSPILYMKTVYRHVQRPGAASSLEQVDDTC